LYQRVKRRQVTKPERDESFWWTAIPYSSSPLQDAVPQKSLTQSWQDASNQRRSQPI
jgi:hypothetical protein